MRRMNWWEKQNTYCHPTSCRLAQVSLGPELGWILPCTLSSSPHSLVHVRGDGYTEHIPKSSSIYPSSKTCPTNSPSTSLPLASILTTNTSQRLANRQPRRWQTLQLLLAHAPKPLQRRLPSPAERTLSPSQTNRYRQRLDSASSRPTTSREQQHQQQRAPQRCRTPGRATHSSERLQRRRGQGFLE